MYKIRTYHIGNNKRLLISSVDRETSKKCGDVRLQKKK